MIHLDQANANTSNLPAASALASRLNPLRDLQHQREFQEDARQERDNNYHMGVPYLGSRVGRGTQLGIDPQLVLSSPRSRIVSVSALLPPAPNNVHYTLEEC